jgi:hemolysin III
METSPPPAIWLTRWFREPVNTMTHGVGVLFGIVALVVLLVLSGGEPWRTTAFAVYGASMILLYLASSVMHGAKVGPEMLRRLRLFDHAAIFLLIAGTYTPVTLVVLRPEVPAWGWTLFGVAWGFALLGVVFKLFWLEAPRWLSTVLYAAMGWMALVAVVPMLQTLAWGGLIWLLVGGLFYSVGAMVYALKWPNPFPRVLGYHEIWHLFVLAGSASHFVLMLRYVLPQG